MNLKEIKISTEFIKLDAFLKWCAIASSGGEAKIYIYDELVKVNGEVCIQRGKKIRVTDVVSFDGEDYKII